MNRELIFLRTFAVATVIGMVGLTSLAFKTSGNQKFSEIDVERINMVEKDGTVKMIITNVDRFPNGKDNINGRPTNETRKKRSGMLFFNEDGIECGGFIYDGQKNENGHSSGLSLTYDQYDGDQVMQLITQDHMEGDKRFVTSNLVFNDQTGKTSSQMVPRMMLGKTGSGSNGLFILADDGSPRAMFYVDKENNGKLDFYDEKGNVISSFPEK
ncbi:hypothetical protein M8845_14725 [Gelidibacter japonicus]|uniref:hypothetical protein n=1 Tax=Gelidibacter japonicus TaxID=1962232 RepID=UPI0020228A3E|nr:hypothetical protein [Gelidibacter japonicus]MCL8008680.1 hypothetical protein [Gelidibacter japonicus]